MIARASTTKQNSQPTRSGEQLAFRLAPSILAAVAVATMLGCRAPVQREVYSKQMTNEIRVLEDQLYDADYQNRILRDELKRVQENCDPGSSAHSHRNAVPNSLPRQTYGPTIAPGPMSPSQRMPLQDQPSDYVTDDFSGGSASSGTLDANQSPSDAMLPPSVPTIDPSPNADIDRVDPSEALPVEEFGELPAPKINSQEFGELPAPMIAEPPGPETFKVPPIDPGKLTPPPLPGTPEDIPPGRVKLPKGLDASLNYSSPVLPDPIQPDHIQLHPSLSSAHQFDQDDEADGLWVVVNVVDADGRILSLNDFDVDATMTIVALDPSMDTSVAKIGRWDFSADEVKSFIRSIPVDGLHVPVKWQDNEPTGEDVIVHVRLQAEGEEMRCQGKLKLNASGAMAKWLPRGGPIQR